jgi:hypothetical protein
MVLIDMKCVNFGLLSGILSALMSGLLSELCQ